nr:retrovirus-related Pol polyprotein from transposon TNT 1-94 [Tanacetum cinerariifolium]
DLKRELRVFCYTDAGYLTDADDLKSQTGYVFVLNGGAVDWKSAKQSIFVTSSAKAEYIAAFDASKEAVWVRKFISGLSVVLTIEEPISMYCDNTGAIAIANESRITKGAKHFRAKVHYLREGLRASRKLKPRALSLYVGNSQREAVEAIGAFYLCLPSGLEIILNNCHYAPSITRGVISVFRLYGDGFVNRFVDNTIQNSDEEIENFKENSMVCGNGDVSNQNDKDKGLKYVDRKAIDSNKQSNVESGSVNSSMDNYDDNQDKSSYMDKVNNNELNDKNKLDHIPTVINEDGLEFIIFNDDLVKKGSKRWELSACGYFVGYKMSIQELSMCKTGIGRIGYARVLVKVPAKKGLVDSIDVLYKSKGSSKQHVKKVRVEYDWKPPVCSHCGVFGHINSKCANKFAILQEVEEKGLSLKLNKQEKDEVGRGLGNVTKQNEIKKLIKNERLSEWNFLPFLLCDSWLMKLLSASSTVAIIGVMGFIVFDVLSLFVASSPVILKEYGHFANKCPSKKEEQSNLIEEDLEPTLLMATIEEAPGSFINQEELRSKNGRKFHSASN